ncbi:Mlo-related protein - like 10 [Theobroma cacao]|nr:Mlo-related protein - like 10 [Theobroma cacao]
MAGEEATTSSGTTLERTPTWAVATVVFVLILISIFIEHMLHLLAKYLLINELDILTLELMLLGFISLLLTVAEKQIANICIPKNVGESFLPCGDYSNDSEEEAKCEEQMRRWESWEAETRTLEYQFSNVSFIKSEGMDSP